MNVRLKKFVREIQHISPIRKYFFPRFPYVNMNAAHLCFLCECIEKTRDVPGKIIEIGCANGSTAIFLNKYMEARSIQKEYICIDTFAGFPVEDINYERKYRGKSPGIKYGWENNKKKWVDATLKYNNVRASTIQADANTFDFSAIGEIAFCLLDVDLYRPVKSCLPRIYKVLSENGILVTDDCDPHNHMWDGADEAYKEFVKEISQPEQVVLGKLGVIKKPKA